MRSIVFGAVTAALLSTVALAAKPVGKKADAPAPVDEQAAAPAKAEEKAPAKADEKKADEKTPAKADEKKADGKTPAKADEKASATPAKADEKAAAAPAKADEKAAAAPAKADEKAAATPAKAAEKAPEKAPEPAERAIEKTEGDYHFRLVLRPGNLKPRRVSDVTVEVYRILEIPDPTYGDRLPLRDIAPIAIVQPPNVKDEVKDKRREAPPPSRYVLWPLQNPGSFGFHFTAANDGLYTLVVTGTEPDSEGLEPRTFEAKFRLGVGTEAAQTEQSQGSASARRGARRPVGGKAVRAEEQKLIALMEEIGERYLDLDDLLDGGPKKGTHPAAAAEARAIANLFAQLKGLTPVAYKAGATEFDKLATEMPALFEKIALAADPPAPEAPPVDPKAKGKAKKPKDPEWDSVAARAAFVETEKVGCMQCHVKYRWGVTTDVSKWPEFEQKPWKK